MSSSREVATWRAMIHTPSVDQSNCVPYGPGAMMVPPEPSPLMIAMEFESVTYAMLSPGPHTSDMPRTPRSTAAPVESVRTLRWPVLLAMYEILVPSDDGLGNSIGSGEAMTSAESP